MTSPRLFRTPESERLSQLVGLRTDLEMAEELAARLLDEFHTHRDPLVVDALAEALVIRYGRCFEAVERGVMDPQEVAASGLGKAGRKNWCSQEESNPQPTDP